MRVARACPQRSRGPTLGHQDCRRDTGERQHFAAHVRLVGVARVGRGSSEPAAGVHRTNESLEPVNSLDRLGWQARVFEYQSAKVTFGHPQLVRGGRNRTRPQESYDAIDPIVDLDRSQPRVDPGRVFQLSCRSVAEHGVQSHGLVPKLGRVHPERIGNGCRLKADASHS